MVCEQFVDRTTQRSSTFFDGPVSFHPPMAHPYCAQARPLAVDAARGAGFTTHDSGTVVVIEGPRFSTLAESQHYRSAGWQLVNMTQCPEAPLARELGLCFCGIGYVTDYDAGVEGDAGATPVTEEQVFTAFAEALPRLRSLVLALAAALPDERSCTCAHGRGPIESLSAR
jgi:5'-methylthioadenosine phosphorylase